MNSISLLTKAFLYMPHLVVLNLYNLGIEFGQEKQKAFTLLANALPCLRNLQELNLSNKYAGEASIAIAKCLTKLSKLEKLLM